MTMKPLLFMFFLTVACFCSCSKKAEKTTVQVDDPVRHYYPVVSGQKLEMDFKIVNTGKEPLIVKDIQPSCGCIVVGTWDRFIVPGGEQRIQFTFDSSKNVGYVQHVIRLFGNIYPRGMMELVFDVNVVPPSDFTPDYEERYQKELAEKQKMRNAVDGNVNEQGYYVDPAHDSREQAPYPWRE